MPWCSTSMAWLHKEVEFGRRLDRVGHYHRLWCCDQWLVEAPTRLLPLLLQLFRWKLNAAEGCPTSRTPWSLTVRPLKTYRLNPNLLEAAGSSAPTIHCSRWDWESIFGKKNWQKKTLNSRHIIIKSIFIKPYHFFSHRFEKGFLLCKYDIKIIHEFIMNTIFGFFYIPWVRRQNAGKPVDSMQLNKRDPGSLKWEYIIYPLCEPGCWQPPTNNNGKWVSQSRYLTNSNNAQKNFTGNPSKFTHKNVLLLWSPPNVSHLLYAWMSQEVSKQVITYLQTGYIGVIFHWC